MLIACPNCSTSYAIDPTSLGPAGRTVRCARCKGTWFADGAKPEPELTAVDAGTAAEGTFTGVLRPDHPVNSSGGEIEHRPAGDEAGDFFVTPEHPAASETPSTVVDAPSVVPSIEPSANSPDEADADEIENFAARRKRLQATQAGTTLIPLDGNYPCAVCIQCRTCRSA
jgi:predicted Zn finger-like uncharacterized protein